jgi:MoxR-like ATPase
MTAIPVSRVGVAFAALALCASAAGQQAFPDEWFFDGANRPAGLKALEGKPAPAIEIAEWKGDEVTIADEVGKVVVIDFWATWCPPCMAAIPENVDLVKEHGDDIAFVGVHDSKSGWQKVDSVISSKGINYSVGKDDGGKSTKAYNLQFWPTYVVIDKKGIVRGAGLVPGKVKDAVERLLAEDGPAPRGKAAGKIAFTPFSDDLFFGGEKRSPSFREAEGQKAPALVAAAWHGEALPRSAFRGQIVVYQFVRPELSMTMAPLGALGEVAKKYKDAGVTFVAVCDARSEFAGLTAVAEAAAEKDETLPFRLAQDVQKLPEPKAEGETAGGPNKTPRTRRAASRRRSRPASLAKRRRKTGRPRPAPASSRALSACVSNPRPSSSTALVSCAPRVSTPSTSPRSSTACSPNRCPSCRPSRPPNCPPKREPVKPPPRRAATAPAADATTPTPSSLASPMTETTAKTNGRAAALPAEAEFARIVREHVAQTVVGQQQVVERVLIALLTGGHLLLEGVPGIAKTLLVQAIGKTIHLDFKRVQFTIDLLPSDIIGSEILDQQSGKFRVRKGPIFTNLLLADEINRASPKVQSALLEAMQERKVSIGDETHDLPAPFLVIATQNPVEQAGTFELPEAQLDRFMLCHRLSYPGKEDETEVVRRALGLGLKKQGDGAVPMSAFDAITDDRKLHIKDLSKAMGEVQKVHVSDVFVRDCVELVGRTRSHPQLALGCSPRAALALVHAARARAFIHGRDYAVPEDLFVLAEDVILHRVRLTYEALADGKRPQDVLADLLASMA